MRMQGSGQGSMTSHKGRTVKEVEWLLQALVGPSVDFDLSMSELGECEGHGPTGFTRTPRAAAWTKDYP